MTNKNVIVENIYNDVLEELLTEAVQQNRIISSMRDKKVIKIYYDGDEVELSGWRSIEPFCYGTINTKNGTFEYIRAWLRNDWSATLKSGKARDRIRWRLFRTDRISSYNNTIHNFKTDKDYMSQFRKKYNPNDKQMDNIIYSINPE